MFRPPGRSAFTPASFTPSKTETITGARAAITQGETTALNWARMSGAAISFRGAEERADTGMRLNGALYLAEFRLEWGLPVWRYEIGGTIIEKRVMMPHGQNTTLVTYTMVEGDGRICLELRPAVQFRPHEGKLGEPLLHPYELSVIEDRYELCLYEAHLPPLRMMIPDHPAAAQ